MDSQANRSPFSLPPEVLARLLQHVNLQQRLSSCALVCRAWHTAAAAATTTIDVRLRAPTNTTLSRWLFKNGSAMSRLCFDGAALTTGSYSSLQLPFQQLQQLQHLSAKELHLSAYEDPASSTSSGSLGALSSLTSLQLDNIQCGMGAQLAPPSALTNLRCLQLMMSGPWHNNHYCDAAGDDLSAGLSTALDKLTRLTHLTLHIASFDDDALESVSSLQQLRELKLGGYNLSTSVLATLPLSLTLLQLYYCGGLQLSSSSTRRLAQLTGLKELAVQGANVHPEVLSNLVQLTHLHLPVCGMVPDVGAGAATLLGVLPRFTQLQHLDLSFTGDHHLLPNVESYSALVPTSLTYLGLRRRQLPAAAVQAMFPAAPGRQLPGLRVLRLDWLKRSDIDDEYLGVLGSSDVCSMVSCCPGLQELRLVGAVRPGVQLTDLAQLTDLKSLTLNGPAVTDEMAAQVLAQLTGLQQLRLTDSDDFSDGGLVPLTRLTCLHDLAVFECGLTGLDEYGYLHMADTASAIGPRVTASTPPVWQQLQAHLDLICRRGRTVSGNFMRAMLERQQGELAQATAGASTAEEEVITLKQQLAAAQQQAMEWQQHFQQLQQQLAASQQQQLAGAQQAQ